MSLFSCGSKCGGHTYGVYVRMHIHVFGNEWDVTLSVYTYMCMYYSSSSSVIIYCSQTCEI